MASALSYRPMANSGRCSFSNNAKTPRSVPWEALGFFTWPCFTPIALFFGYDQYHHHLATNTWDTHRPALPGALGLQSVPLRLGSARGLTDIPSVFDLDGIFIQIAPQ